MIYIIRQLWSVICEILVLTRISHAVSWCGESLAYVWHLEGRLTAHNTKKFRRHSQPVVEVFAWRHTHVLWFILSTIHRNHVITGSYFTLKIKRNYSIYFAKNVKPSYYILDNNILLFLRFIIIIYYYNVYHNSICLKYAH